MTYSNQLDELGIERYLAKYGEREMLKLLTCGSVDDGKSTLIGRLLYDSEQVHDDVLAATTKASSKFGTTGEEIDLALLVVAAFAPLPAGPRAARRRGPRAASCRPFAARLCRLSALARLVALRPF